MLDGDAASIPSKICSRICPPKFASSARWTSRPASPNTKSSTTSGRAATRTPTGYAIFLGAGVYNHYRPVLVDTVVSRGEFLTSYTPYQAEIAQGTLTTIFEFQTMICQLTGMDVANASMYDGSTAVPEAAMMAVRITGRDRVLVSRTVHPEYREVLRHLRASTRACRSTSSATTRDRRASIWRISKRSSTTRRPRSSSSRRISSASSRTSRRPPTLAHKHGALLVFVFTEAVSLGLLEPPRDADIVAGELQSFAISPSYGGPFAGIIATKEKFMRQMPGRLVGETKDSRRQPRLLPDALDARAAHPPREGDVEHLHQPGADRADGDGLHDASTASRGCANWPSRTWPRRTTWPAGLTPRFTGPFFNEFVVAAERQDPEEVNAELLEKKIIGGLPLGPLLSGAGGLRCCCAPPRCRSAPTWTRWRRRCCA